MHEPNQPAADYRAYLLRIWRECDGAPWRASLQPAPGGERVGFADLEQLAAYLLRLAGEGRSTPQTSPPAPEALP